jgi:hypothetical protein
VLKRVIAISGIMALAGSSLLADFTYQETSTITGGMMMSMMKVAGVFSKQAREPIQSTIAIKGDRMVHRSATHASVIDLGSGTITSIDFQKKQYTVMTFEEMKQMMEQMSQKMQKSDKGEMKFKVSATATDKTKQVAGFDAKEMIMKMEMEGTDKESGQKGGMTVTTDMWIASGVPGYQEVREFYKRMSEKINWTPGGNMFATNPQVSGGMAEVYKEVAKLDGVPVQQFISMGVAGQPGAAGAPADGSAAPAQQQPPAAQPQQSAPPPSIGGALGGALGGRFGLGKKKPAADQQAPKDNPPAGTGGQASGAPGSLMEMTTEMSGFSSNPVDASLFAVPAGFKQVDSPVKKMK